MVPVNYVVEATRTARRSRLATQQDVLELLVCRAAGLGLITSLDAGRSSDEVNVNRRREGLTMTATGRDDAQMQIGRSSRTHKSWRMGSGERPVPNSCAGSTAWEGRNATDCIREAWAV